VGDATRDICDAGNVGPAFGAPEHATSNITEQAVIPMVKIGARFMFDFSRMANEGTGPSLRGGVVLSRTSIVAT